MNFWMQMFLLCKILFSVFLLFSPEAAPHPMREEFDIEHIIKHRYLREDGYESFDVAWILEKIEGIQDDHIPLTAESLRRKKTVNSPPTVAQVTIKAHGETFHIVLSYTDSLLHSRAKVFCNTEELWIGKHPDCFVNGHVYAQTGSGSAVLSFCNGLDGQFHVGNWAYAIVSIPDVTATNSSNKDNSNLILVSRKWKSYRCHSLTSANQPVGLSFQATAQAVADVVNRRYKRSSDPLILELAVFADQKMTAHLDLFFDPTKDITLEQQRIHAILMHWGGVQAEFSHDDITNRGIFIKLQIKKVTFVTDDTAAGISYSAWYENEDTTTVPLSRGRSNFCNLVEENKEENMKFDVLYMHTGATNTDVQGLAASPGGACSDTLCNRCAISSVLGLYPLTAHEIGHTLGMIHDAEFGSTCTTYPNIGIMGSQTTTGWSSCSVDYLETFLQTTQSDCLREEIASVADNLNGLDIKSGWPGLRYTLHQICAAQYGYGYTFRHIDSVGFCSDYVCIKDDDVIIARRPIPGRWCVEGKVCASDVPETLCKNWELTGLPLELFQPVEGVWSDWKEVVNPKCIGVCGENGIFVEKRRICNNPTRPIMARPCSGSNIIGYECTPECTDAASTCQSIARAYARGSGNCVKFCTDGSTKAVETGLSCKPEEGLEGWNIADENGWPRISGLHGICHSVDCKISDCFNRFGEMKRFDDCGVCDGMNELCYVYKGIFSNETQKGERTDLTTFPIGSYHIQIWFDHSLMRGLRLELYDPTGIPILQDKEDEKIQGVGTLWTFKWGDNTEQYLIADGPTDGKVLLKVYQKEENQNTGINYEFSVHKEYQTTAQELEDINRRIVDEVGDSPSAGQDFATWLGLKIELDTQRYDLTKKMDDLKEEIAKLRK